MEFFIKKIFEKKHDNLVHLQFQKFSRGEFKDRAVVIGRKTAKSYSISTSAEYVNEFVRYMAEKLGNSKTKVTGIIVSTQKLDIDYQNISQFQGIKKYKMDKEMSGNEILEICDKLPNAFIALSFSTNDSELKIKEKLPKTGKPGKGDEEVKANFCRIKTTDEKLVRNLIFDSEVKDFKKVEIKHTFLITDIEIPTELKNEKDFSKVREGALKNGKIIREINVDDNKIKKEEDLKA